MNTYWPYRPGADTIRLRLRRIAARSFGFFAVIGGVVSVQSLEPAAGEKPLRVLEQRCLGCHGPDQPKGGLDLSTRAGLLRGGQSGSVVAEGKPGESLLIQLVRHEKEPGMPHKEEPLAAEEVEVLVGWVEEGFPYGRELKSQTPPPEFRIAEVDRKHWAFQPVKRPPLPAVRDSEGRAQNEIDLFIVERLEAAGKELAQPATREQLIRRLSVDLTGLLPTIEEIDQFVADASPAAVENLIDRLLASTRYGERW